MHITTLQALRAIYKPASVRALKKEIPSLDVHAVQFIGLSPFMVIASGGASGDLDASPRGGEPGFVKVLDAQTLLIPDAPGNNRLDTLENIVSTGQLGLLFLVPGFDETLRDQIQAFKAEAIEVEPGFISTPPCTWPSTLAWSCCRRRRARRGPSTLRWAGVWACSSMAL